MKQHEQASIYLRKAAEDEALLDEVLDSPRVSDAVIGFHCQQAAEKLLKALLSYLGVKFRKTHDLRELMDLLEDRGCSLPEYLNDLDELTPYAVELRYDFFLWEAEFSLDRLSARGVIRKLRIWVQQKIGQSPTGDP